MDNPKPNARILDATAANRTIWKTKQDDRIIWIDIEPELEIKPDFVMDCTKTDFPDEYFHHIFFDPPYGSGHSREKGDYFCIRNKAEMAKFERERGFTPVGKWTYYGLDKYKTKMELFKFIYIALEEFYRILRSDGILMLKWNEMEVPLSRVMNMTKDWIEIMRITVGSVSQNLGSTQTYWVLLMKKKKEQATL